MISSVAVCGWAMVVVSNSVITDMSFVIVLFFCVIFLPIGIRSCSHAIRVICGCMFLLFFWLTIL